MRPTSTAAPYAPRARTQTSPPTSRSTQTTARPVRAWPASSSARVTPTTGTYSTSPGADSSFGRSTSGWPWASSTATATSATSPSSGFQGCRARPTAGTRCIWRPPDPASPSVSTGARPSMWSMAHTPRAVWASPDTAGTPSAMRGSPVRPVRRRSGTGSRPFRPTPSPSGSAVRICPAAAWRPTGMCSSPPAACWRAPRTRAARGAPRPYYPRSSGASPTTEAACSAPARVGSW